MKNIPILTFIQRTWYLILAWFASDWLALTQHHFTFIGDWQFDEMRGWEWVARTPSEAFGAQVYVPSLVILVTLCALLCVHLFYRATIDADANSGQYLTDWRSCTSFQRVLIGTIVRIGIIIGFCLLCAGLARGAAPVDEVKRWKEATINAHDTIALDVAVSLFRKNQSRYQLIEQMRPNGVPAPILFCLHYRESDNDFHSHAHEGSPLRGRTRDEPKGRLLTPDPPYTFEQSAFDAYYVCEHPPLDKINWRDMQSALDKMESFNGYGYRRLGIAAPYNWSGTSLYKSGKYVSDHHFSSSAVDRQLGCAAILKRMQSKGIAISFIRG